MANQNQLSWAPNVEEHAAELIALHLFNKMWALWASVVERQRVANFDSLRSTEHLNGFVNWLINTKDVVMINFFLSASVLEIERRVNTDVPQFTELYDGQFKLVWFTFPSQTHTHTHSHR